jgi:hypothetical protein
MRHILPGMNRAARTALLCLMAAGLLSGCGTLARPFGKGKNAISGPLLEDAPPVSIVAVKGPPKRLGERVAAHVTAEADRRGFEATRKPPTSRAFRMTGTLSAANTPRGVAVAYVWDLTDAIGAGRHRIAGQEIVPAFEVKDPWTAVDNEVMLRIGQYTAEGLAGFLGQRGYDVRNIALPPPPGVPPNNCTMSMVPMASPAPFTMHPISPSSLTYDSPYLRASVSCGDSSSRSRISARSGCRYSALSSRTILPSKATKRPSPVMTNGLISARLASLA